MNVPFGRTATAMPRFIPASTLKQSYDVFGHFYRSSFRPKRRSSAEAS